MYKAIIKNKVEVPQGIEVTVEFTDGVKTITETIIPQDKRGFEHWRDSRLASLNSIEDIQANLNINDEFLAPAAVEKTQAELDKEQWFRQYGLLERLETLESKAFLTGTKLTALNNKITEVKTYLDANIKVEYLNEL